MKKVALAIWLLSVAVPFAAARNGGNGNMPPQPRPTPTAPAPGPFPGPPVGPPPNANDPFAAARQTCVDRINAYRAAFGGHVPIEVMTAAFGEQIPEPLLELFGTVPGR